MKKITSIIILVVLSVSLFSFGKNKVQRKDLEWSKIKTIHYNIYFEKGKNEFGKIAALLAEEAYYRLKADFNVKLRAKIPIIIYESHQDFETTNIIYPILNESVGGFTESMKNRVVVPFDGNYKKFEEVLTHELTHAYINSLQLDNFASKLISLRTSRFPFWFQEGLPEFEAVYGTDIHNRMFIIDMVINEYLYPLTRLNNFYAYREGESFLVFLSKKYGRDKVMKLFYSIKFSPDIDKSFEKIFGLNLEDMEKRWKTYLKRRFSRYLLDYNLPYESLDQLTFHKEDGSYFNFSPSISPDNETYLYFSNKKLRNGIWKGNLLELEDNERIIKGQTTGEFEDFHYQRMNISWFPEGKKYAFVAKTSTGDVIYVKNLESNKTVKEIRIPELDAVYEIDISNDGNKIALSGQADMKNDIYIYNLNSQQITQITNDRYCEMQPRWSPQDKKIAFTSDRTTCSSDPRQAIFHEMRNNIYYYDLNEDSFWQVTFDKMNNYQPLWNSSGNNLLFVSERDSVANFSTINLAEGKIGQVTKVLSGTTSGDLSKDDETLILSCFYENGWDIYVKYDPLSDVDYKPYKKPQKIKFHDDFYSKFELDRYKYYGERKTESSDKKGSKRKPPIYKSRFNYIDSLFVKKDGEKKPVKEVNKPVIKPYTPEFSLDYFWGGLAYSSTAGMIGQLNMSFSDLMGNHGFNLNTGLSGNFKESDLQLSYIYLKKRIDYGFSAFKLFDDTVYRIYPTNNEHYYYQKYRHYYYGASFLMRYPFNKFWRIDFDNYLYKYEKKVDEARIVDEETNSWSEWKNVYSDNDLIYNPRISLVHDNAIYGSTGPISGWRSYLTLDQGIAKNHRNHTTLFTDFRAYFFFLKRYTFATRFVGGASFGEEPQEFDLEGLSGVRGYESEDELGYTIEGTRKVLGSFELRYPFLDVFKISFPLPLTFRNIRGAVFTDIGGVWTDKFRGIEDGRLKDLKMGYGFGPRMNAGYFVLKLDITWHTDLHTNSKPTYYISLWPDF